ncbi:helix-turn-helix domain-containing protein [Mycolicibacterium diernhoferi]|uniref:DNA-binding protein n=1 Tax=Mycolicibacterium diernhoferi TaxID=1801 RepID=A0A1Q4H7H4_9MYCO|nr:XRE family transcriptional regulator [Mycolicibacterium diernhoferi]OJZ63500.1 DNA-binding protein [Mycolicibacterium diernhoferi]OPE56286.1 DNA-binding protein [Mycolicibacterium diernhoferi]PEG55515.1 DNA-binding protein [Mycolicibacterium diernhoferi]QYL24431.1 XRE family transcriptional regulator [Mycolicibacterium diernhoferi]
MDAELKAVGDRIRSRLPLGMSQKRLAEKAGMTPDALSRALNGQRGFSSTELARLADELGADVYWMITGRDDPRKVEIAARHKWDPKHRRRDNPGRDVDEAVLGQVIAAYQAAFPSGPPASRALPKNPLALRELLGEAFVRDFSDEVENKLGVDIVRIAGLTTDYSLRIGSRSIIILATTPRWFRSNWSLAHELGHLALGHHDGLSSTDRKNEGPADSFAANLLLPSEEVSNENWDRKDEAGLARYLWFTGVSTQALRNRLAALQIKPAAAVEDALVHTTPRLIRAHAETEWMIGGEAAVSLREQQASTRLVPAVLVDALHREVEAGNASPELLAWALDVPVDEIEFPEPDDKALADARVSAIENRPSADDLANWLAVSESK